MRGALIVGLWVGLSGVTRAALWENRDWALTSTVAGSTGYDSNLTLSHDGPGDLFIQATPQLKLLRRNSSTDLHATAAVTATEFLHDRQPGQTDFIFSARHAYPFGDNVIPRSRSDLSWQRTSEPDQYLGRRVRHDRISGSTEGYFRLTGKLALQAEADAYNDKYKDRTLNDNTRWRVFTGLAYEKRPGLSSSLNFGYSEGRSKPNRFDTNTTAVRSEEHYMTVRLRGVITPKITGTVYGGFGQVRYRGGYANQYNLPVAGADLTWGVDPRRTVVLAAYSGADYAPDGQAVNSTRAFLSFTHVIIGRWQYIVRGGPTRTVFRREVRQSTDRSWEGGVEFAYTPSDRFRVGLGVSGAKHDSDVRDRKYDRYKTSLNSTYRF